MRHYWNDDWQYWNELYAAEAWIEGVFGRIRKKTMRTKEKYGTVRYEYTWTWLQCPEDIRVFKHVVRGAVKRFPNVAAEICDSAQHVLDDEYFNGWCAGVCYLASKGKGSWSNNNGIVGFPDKGR